MELLIIVIALALMVLVLIKAKIQKGQKTQNYPYSKRTALFTPAERSFLGVMDLAIGDKARILGKVRVADVITPKSRMSRSDWQRAFNKISAKHFDFILCDKKDLSIICAVELDDSSHQRANRKKRDSLLVAACASAGIPLIQIPAKATYSVADVRKLLSPHIKTISTLETSKEDIDHD